MVKGVSQPPAIPPSSRAANHDGELPDPEVITRALTNYLKDRLQSAFTLSCSNAKATEVIEAQTELSSDLTRLGQALANPKTRFMFYSKKDGSGDSIIVDEPAFNATKLGANNQIYLEYEETTEIPRVELEKALNFEKLKNTVKRITDQIINANTDVRTIDSNLDPIQFNLN